MRESLTEKRVASLESTGERLDISDAACPGLWLRVTPNGVRTFSIRYRANGRLARYTIGTYPTVSLKVARAEAFSLFTRIRAGEDPRHRKMDARIIGKHVTVDFIVDHYRDALAKRVRQKKYTVGHAMEIERRLKAEVVPKIGDRPFESVTRETIKQLLDGIERRAPRVAGHIYYDLCVLYKWALRENLIKASPMLGIEPPPKPEARDRVLSAEELRRIWSATDATTSYATIVRLLMLTAARRGEVTSARWSEFDLARGVWTIPRSRTKNKREHRLPLSSLALSTLLTWQRADGSGADLLFPARGDGEGGLTFSGFSRAKRRLDKQAGVSDWTIHDIRRTVATCLAEMGTLPHVIERILNHTQGTMTPIARVYNRASYEAEMHTALERWSQLAPGFDHLGRSLGVAAE